MLRDAIGIASGLSRRRKGFDSPTQRYRPASGRCEVSKTLLARFDSESGCYGVVQKAAGAVRMRANRRRYPAAPPK